VAESAAAAYDLAFATDPTSAFGGIIAFNRPLDAATAAAILERQFLEVLSGPERQPFAHGSGRLEMAQANKLDSMEKENVDSFKTKTPESTTELTEEQKKAFEEFKKAFNFGKVLLCGIHKEEFITYFDEMDDITMCYAIDCLNARRFLRNKD